MHFSFFFASYFTDSPVKSTRALAHSSAISILYPIPLPLIGRAASSLNAHVFFRTRIACSSTNGCSTTQRVTGTRSGKA